MNLCDWSSDVCSSDLLRGSVQRGYPIFCLASTAAIFAIVTVTIAVLGSYGTVTRFPFYTATGVFQLGAFQNLDALQIGVWTLGGFLKSAFYLWLCRHCLQKAFPIFQKFLPACVLALAAAVCASLYSGNESRLDRKSTRLNSSHTDSSRMPSSA